MIKSIPRLNLIVLLLAIIVPAHSQSNDLKRVDIDSREQCKSLGTQVILQVLSIDHKFIHQKQWMLVSPNDRIQASLVENFDSDQYSIRIFLGFYDSQELAQQVLSRRPTFSGEGKQLLNLGDEAYGQFDGKVILRRGNVCVFIEINPKKEEPVSSKGESTKDTSEKEQDKKNETANQPETLEFYEYTTLEDANKQVAPKVSEPLAEYVLAKKIAESVVKVLDEYSK